MAGTIFVLNSPSQRMIEADYAWLYDGKGLQPIPPEFIPPVDQLLDDPYRSLAWMSRNEVCKTLQKTNSNCIGRLCKDKRSIFRLYVGKFLSRTYQSP